MKRGSRLRWLRFLSTFTLHFKDGSSVTLYGWDFFFTLQRSRLTSERLDTLTHYEVNGICYNIPSPTPDVPRIDPRQLELAIQL